jgi:hypothetical protein
VVRIGLHADCTPTPRLFAQRWEMLSPAQG